MTSELLSGREKIARLAEEIRSRFGDVSRIEDIAAASDILLVIEDGPLGKDAGFAFVQYISEPVFIESLARPGEFVRVWGEERRTAHRSIVINPNGGVPEREVFWHEYYHLFHSPNGVQHSERFPHRYSTEGVLHNIEERRADEFAAAVLISPLDELDDIPTTMDRFSVSERLAKCAMNLARQLAANAGRQM